MTLLTLVVRSLRERSLSATLTGLSAATGVALVVAILLLRAGMEKHYAEPGRGFSLVIGPPGSRLELVLNSIYHVDQSAGLLPWKSFEEVRAHPSVRLAVPCAVGDSFRGFRVVGTTEAIFDRGFPHPSGEGLEKFAQGRPFKVDPDALAHVLEDMRTGSGNAHHHEDDEHPREAVLGAEVAERLGIGLGVSIEPTHGVEGGKEHGHDEHWTVTGILKRTGTPIDRVVLIDLASFYSIPEHSAGVVPNSGDVGLSSVLVFPKPGIHKALLLPRLMNRAEFTVAEVAAEIQTLFSIVGRVDQIFLMTAVLVTVLGVMSIMVAIYNSMAARKREVAILRAVGAHRRTVFGVIVVEAALIAGLGASLGILAGHGLVWLAGGTIEAAAGFRPGIEPRFAEESLLLAAVTLLGALAGTVPAMVAYRADVASGLKPLT